MGLAASTIDLGPVLETSYSDRQSAQTQAQVRDTFGGEMSVAEVLANLDVAISRQQQQTQTSDIKAPKTNLRGCDNETIIGSLRYTGHRAQTSWTRNPLLTHLIHAHEMSLSHSNRTSISLPNGNSPHSTRHLIQNSSTLASARAHIYNSLATKFSIVLMIEPEDLRPDRTLASYGTDSLMAVEIRSWIRREMEASVIVIDMLADNTLESLTEIVMEKSALVEKLKGA